MVLPRQSEGKKKFAKSEATSGARAALMAGGTYGKNSPESKQVKVNGEGSSDAPESVAADRAAGMTGDSPVRIRGSEKNDLTRVSVGASCLARLKCESDADPVGE